MNRPLPARAWIAVAVLMLLVAAHAALFSLFSRAPLSLALLALGAGLVALKYALWRFRS